MNNVLIFAASNNNNLKLAQKIKSAFEDKSVNVDLVDLTQLTLPVYTSVEEKNGIPEGATYLLKLLSNASTLITVAPEYNGGIPPVLTNAISWISRSGDKDWRKAFNGKKAVVATHSGSGGMHVLMAMRMQLSYLGMNVLGRQIQTHYTKELSEETLDNIIEQILN